MNTTYCRFWSLILVLAFTSFACGGCGGGDESNPPDVNGGEQLTVSWQGPEIAKQPIPKDVLSISDNPCTTANENANAIFSCPSNKKIVNILFASYGTPNGSCGNYTIGTCNAVNSVSIIKGKCLNQNSCTVPATNVGFGGDPCAGTNKRLYSQYECQ